MELQSESAAMVFIPGKGRDEGFFICVSHSWRRTGERGERGDRGVP